MRGGRGSAGGLRPVLAYDIARTVWQAGVDGGDLSFEERHAVQARQGYTVEIARQAVELVSRSSGASSIRTDCIPQQICQDMQGMTIHAGFNLTSLFEAYGRVRLGLPPTTQFA
ncbi:Acyl-CoA dehydrogenase, C-terminal domain [Pseudonocardia ammonioxydans]|uniref:Acyl-CoA dehydrogenase, C-terminal domain n=1 Tax=Pseudonocardia ammonioxydans TaxID=260086 RepID=A0A1I5HQM2_PSUAM|nr:Acyl-CoA dehydrogenase, C-terminal domain [Pseudonocardia ammonioxydans]